MSVVGDREWPSAEPCGLLSDPGVPVDERTHSRITVGPGTTPGTRPAQSPAVSRPPLPGGDPPREGRPVPEHGGTGDHPRSHRAPPDDPVSEPLRFPGAGGERGRREARLPGLVLVAGGVPRRLAGIELLDWLALRRVGEGGVAMLGSHYLDRGRRVPCFLPEALRRLAEGKLTELLDSDSPGGLRRVVITSRGRARYRELSAMRGLGPCPDRGRSGPHIQE